MCSGPFYVMYHHRQHHHSRVTLFVGAVSVGSLGLSICFFFFLSISFSPKRSICTYLVLYYIVEP